jgi:Amino acid permease
VDAIPDWKYSLLRRISPDLRTSGHGATDRFFQLSSVGFCNVQKVPKKTDHATVQGEDVPNERCLELSYSKEISRMAKKDVGWPHFAYQVRCQNFKKMNSQFHRSLHASLPSHWLVLLLLLGPAVVHAAESTDRVSQAIDSALSDPSSKQGDMKKLTPPSQPTTHMIIEITTGEMHLTSPTIPPQGAVSRWFALETASISSRYHFLGNLGGATTGNTNQYQASCLAVALQPQIAGAKWLSPVNRGGTPTVALFICTLVASALVLSGSFETLIAIASILFVTVYLSGFISLFALRMKKPNLLRPFKAWLYPWGNLFVLVASAAFLVGSVIADLKDALFTGVRRTLGSALSTGSCWQEVFYNRFRRTFQSRWKCKNVESRSIIGISRSHSRISPAEPHSPDSLKCVE